MLRIRFARTGKKKQASYRVVVAEKSRAVQSKFVEILGWYNPHTKELQVDKEKLQVWLSKGASPSDSMAKIFKLNGIELPSWVKIVEKNKEPKKKAQATAASKAEASKEEISEEPAIEAEAEQVVEESSKKDAVDETIETVAPTEEPADNEEVIVEEAIPDVSEAEEVDEAKEDNREKENKE
ncbi:30S ribosomal protein S16 [bacterium (Candidatus Howlettbacteria) CG_4_10_14_0_8_um_filter_40_9]|nr:MAG: 30S ribosomal protein S16 [bacterium (Candidatus Howlettbacteria) CG_4_10_14_0_8_um_filter_40_9]